MRNWRTDEAPELIPAWNVACVRHDTRLGQS